MTIDLSYNDDLSRVQIALTDIPTGTVTVERSTNNLFWQTVRGASIIPITAGAVSIDDYEFNPDVLNTYRVTQLNQEDNVDTFTVSSTWTKPAGLVAARVTVIGAGGGGGGAAITTAGQCSAGNGGAPGGIAISVIDAATLGATETVTVGAAGAGASGASGTSGGTSSFGTHVVAAGGSGGSFFAASTTNQIGVGTGPANGTTGQILATGTPGGQAFSLPTPNAARGGLGGSGPFGGGGTAGLNGTGSAGNGHGAGGGGTANAASQASARTGGAGTGGLVIVEHIFAG